METHKNKERDAQTTYINKSRGWPLKFVGPHGLARRVGARPSGPSDPLATLATQKGYWTQKKNKEHQRITRNIEKEGKQQEARILKDKQQITMKNKNNKGQTGTHNQTTETEETT